MKNMVIFAFNYCVEALRRLPKPARTVLTEIWKFGKRIRRNVSIFIIRPSLIARGWVLNYLIDPDRLLSAKFRKELAGQKLKGVRNVTILSLMAMYLIGCLELHYLGLDTYAQAWPSNQLSVHWTEAIIYAVAIFAVYSLAEMFAQGWEVLSTKESPRNAYLPKGTREFWAGTVAWHFALIAVLVLPHIVGVDSPAVELLWAFGGPYWWLIIVVWRLVVLYENPKSDIYVPKFRGFRALTDAFDSQKPSHETVELLLFRITMLLLVAERSYMGTPGGGMPFIDSTPFVMYFLHYIVVIWLVVAMYQMAVRPSLPVIFYSVVGWITLNIVHSYMWAEMFLNFKRAFGWFFDPIDTVLYTMIHHQSQIYRLVTAVIGYYWPWLCTVGTILLLIAGLAVLLKQAKYGITGPSLNDLSRIVQLAWRFVSVSCSYYATRVGLVCVKATDILTVRYGEGWQAWRAYTLMVIMNVWFSFQLYTKTINEEVWHFSSYAHYIDYLRFLHVDQLDGYFTLFGTLILFSFLQYFPVAFAFTSRFTQSPNMFGVRARSVDLAFWHQGAKLHAIFLAFLFGPAFVLKHLGVTFNANLVSTDFLVFVLLPVVGAIAVYMSMYTLYCQYRPAKSNASAFEVFESFFTQEAQEMEETDLMRYRALLTAFVAGRYTLEALPFYGFYSPEAAITVSDLKTVTIYATLIVIITACAFFTDRIARFASAWAWVGLTLTVAALHYCFIDLPQAAKDSSLYFWGSKYADQVKSMVEYCTDIVHNESKLKTWYAAVDYAHGFELMYYMFFIGLLCFIFAGAGSSLYIVRTFDKKVGELDLYYGRIAARDIGATFYAIVSVIIIFVLQSMSANRWKSETAVITKDITDYVPYQPLTEAEIFIYWIADYYKAYAELSIMGGNMDLFFNVDNCLDDMLAIGLAIQQMFIKQDVDSVVQFDYDRTYMVIENFTTLQYNLGDYITMFDGVSMWLLWLTAVVGYVTQLSLDTETDNSFISQSFFLGCVVLFSGFCFVTRDLFAFFLSFEAVLVPLFFLVGLHGSRAERIKAAFFLFVFTLVGSTFLWLAVLFASEVLGVTQFDLLADVLAAESAGTRQVLWWLLFLGFAFKVPLVPFHLWLTVAHVEAPTAGSMLLAGLVLKLGGYGMLRFLFLMLPYESAQFSFAVISLCCLGYTLATLMAVRQLDIKRFVAYTSIAHMNFGLAVLFTTQKVGFVAFCHTMISHGIIASALFFLVGFLYRQTGLRDTLRVRGLASILPYFAIAWFVFSMANVGMPLLSGFPGEFYGLLALSMANRMIMLWFIIGFYFTAVYTFLNVSRILYGSYTKKLLGRMLDLTLSGRQIVVLLGSLSGVFGVVPDVVFNTLDLTLLPGQNQTTSVHANRVTRSLPNTDHIVENFIQMLGLNDIHDILPRNHGWVVDMDPMFNPFRDRIAWVAESNFYNTVGFLEPIREMPEAHDYLTNLAASFDRFREPLHEWLTVSLPGAKYNNYDELYRDARLMYFERDYVLNTEDPLTLDVYRIVDAHHIAYMKIWSDGKIKTYTDLVYNANSDLWFETNQGLHFRHLKGIATERNLLNALANRPNAIVAAENGAWVFDEGALNAEMVELLKDVTLQTEEEYLRETAVGVGRTPEEQQRIFDEMRYEAEIRIIGAQMHILKIGDEDSKIAVLKDRVVHEDDKFVISKRYYTVRFAPSVFEHIKVLNEEITCNRYAASYVPARETDSTFIKPHQALEVTVTEYKKCQEMGKDKAVLIPCDTCEGGYKIVTPEAARAAAIKAQQAANSGGGEESAFARLNRIRDEETAAIRVQFPYPDESSETGYLTLTAPQAILVLYPGSRPESLSQVQLPCEECPSGFRIVRLDEALSELIEGAAVAYPSGVKIPDTSAEEGFTHLSTAEAFNYVVSHGVTGNILDVKDKDTVNSYLQITNTDPSTSTGHSSTPVDGSVSTDDTN